MKAYVDRCPSAKILSLPGLALCLLLPLACSHSDSKVKASTTAPVTYVSGSRVKSYASLLDLRKEADLVVVVTVSSAPTGQTKVSDVEFTITSAVVDRVKFDRGTSRVRPGDPIAIRSLGGNTQRAVGGTVLLAGETYLLYLAGFRMDPNSPPTDQYVVVGVDAGMFHGKKGSPTFTREGKDDPGLPSVITEQDVDVSN
jgi:hypothetical protein